MPCLPSVRATVLEEHTDTYFEFDVRDPYMLVVTVLREAYRDVVPAVCHRGRHLPQTPTGHGHPGQRSYAL